MNKRPYVHLYADVQDKLGILARGSNAVVFLAIGVLTPAKTEGIDWQAIAGATGLSDRAIKPALEILLTSGLIEKTASRGKYTAANYMQYKNSTHTVCVDIDDHINRQLIVNQSIVNQSKGPSSTEEKKSFSTSARANYYAAYQDAFGEIAQSRSGQMLETIERIEQYDAEWVTEAFRRTAAKELADVESGGNIWREWRRAPYALRILENWKRAGGIQERITYPTKRERVTRNETAVLEIKL